MGSQPAISGDESTDELQAKIDSGDSYTLDATALTRFLSRFLQGGLSAGQVERIGDLLEAAEFVEYVGPGADGLIAQVVFEMSTPQSTGPITKDAAERWLRLLAD